LIRLSFRHRGQMRHGHTAVWHSEKEDHGHEEMKEDALQKGFPVPGEAAIRERVLRKDVEAPDLATLTDFFQFHAATSKREIVEKMISDSPNTFAERFFAGFERITGTLIDVDVRSEVYNVSIL
jgi:hypothetical protein